MGRRRGLRTQIRESVSCEKGSGGCGATAGERCTAFRDSYHGPASQEPMSEIHGARWHAWLREQPGGKPPDGAPESLLRRFARGRQRKAPDPSPRFIAVGGSGDWDYGPMPPRVSWHEGS